MASNAGDAEGEEQEGRYDDQPVHNSQLEHIVGGFLVEPCLEWMGQTKEQQTQQRLPK